MPAQTNTATQPKCEICGPAKSRIVSRGREAENIWQKLRKARGDLPVNPKRDADVWRVGSAGEEARALFKMLGRNGDDVRSLRLLITVSRAEEVELRDWAASSSPRVAVGIEAMIRYRQAVLIAFDRLVAQGRTNDVTV